MAALVAACALLPVPVLASDAASTGTGGAASATAAGAAPTAAALRAAHQQQRARCLALQVAAVRTECLRQAERDLAQGLAALKPRRP